MVNVFFPGHHQHQWFFNGFKHLDLHHCMFLEGPTISFNGFSIVFEIFRAMVNDGLEVNDGLHLPLHKKVRKVNSRQNANLQHYHPSIETLYTVHQRKGFTTFISPKMPKNVQDISFWIMLCTVYLVGRLIN